MFLNGILLSGKTGFHLQMSANHKMNGTGTDLKVSCTTRSTYGS